MLSIKEEVLPCFTCDLHGGIIQNCRSSTGWMMRHLHQGRPVNNSDKFPISRCSMRSVIMCASDVLLREQLWTATDPPKHQFSGVTALDTARLPTVRLLHVESILSSNSTKSRR